MNEGGFTAYSGLSARIAAGAKPILEDCSLCEELRRVHRDWRKAAVRYKHEVQAALDMARADFAPATKLLKSDIIR